MPMHFTLKGARQVTNNLRRAAINTPELLESAAMAEWEIEKAEVERRTPVDTRMLQKSFQISSAWRGKTLTMYILTDVPYAPIVHEDMDAHHNVGQAKFLESVLDESTPYMARRIAARMKGLGGLL